MRGQEGPTVEYACLYIAMYLYIYIYICPGLPLACMGFTVVSDSLLK